MKNIKTNKFLKFLIIISSALMNGNIFAAKNISIPNDEINNFVRVYAIAKNYYVESVTDAKLMQSAMDGMLANLDPHSMYLDQKSYKQLSEITSGEFGGLGIELSREKIDYGITIVAPIEGTPAYMAGIKSGDVIIKINNEPVNKMKLNEAINKMRGIKGTTVELLIVRKNEIKPLKFTIKRDIIKINSVKYNYLNENYAYIKINDFQKSTVNNLLRILDIIYKAKPKLRGIVLDLRDNPGGILQSAVGVSGVFLPKNKLIVYTKGRFKEANQNYYNCLESYSIDDEKVDLSNLPNSYKTIPLVVIINQGTASASEIVSGALQDYKRAKIIGTKSFGKGSVQTIIPLSNDTAIKLTTALYYTPNDRSIQAEGIIPDIIVKSEYSDILDSWDISEANYKNHLANPNNNYKLAKDNDVVVIEPLKKITTKSEINKRNKQIISKMSKNVNKDIITIDIDNDFQLKWALKIIEGKELPKMKKMKK